MRSTILPFVFAMLLLAAPARSSAEDLNCGEALACLLSCPDNDSQCAFNCGQNLHTKAEDLYAELLVCLAPQCPGNPPDTVCLLQAGAGVCQSQYKSCVDDAGCLGTCEGKECGDDGCGANCGDCPPGMTCDAGTCIMCQPDCSNKECGDNGCGSSCGNCPDGQACIDNVCIACSPNCAGKECGEDGCGGQCGQCGFSEECINGLCVGCTPNCSGKECGDNGCGGMCGACPPNFTCNSGVCEENIPCDANCLEKECGDDGCGGSCGTCGLTQYCSGAGMCMEGDAPEVVDAPDAGDDEFSPGDDDARTPAGVDTVVPSGNQCPDGYKFFFGQCVIDKSEEPADSGCTAGRPVGSLPLILLFGLFIGLVGLRRRHA